MSSIFSVTQSLGSSCGCPPDSFFFIFCFIISLQFLPCCSFLLTHLALPNDSVHGLLSLWCRSKGILLTNVSSACIPVMICVPLCHCLLYLQGQTAVCTSDVHKALMFFLHKIPFLLLWWQNSKQCKNSYYCSSSLSAISAHENDKMIRLPHFFLPLFHLSAYRSVVSNELYMSLFMYVCLCKAQLLPIPE